MRKLFALIIIFAIWYFAGMNTQSYVLASVISLLTVIVIAFIFSRVIRYKIDIYIPPQKNLMFKNREGSLKLSTKNKSVLPVNRLSINLEMKYKTDKSGTRKKLYSGAAGCNDGDTTAELYFTAPYCGLIEVIPKKIRIYDYFGFFSNSRKLRLEAYEVFVLPEPKTVSILMPPFGTYTSHPVADSSSDKSGDDHSEIRLLREYHDGDLMRHIHRNLTAKTEKLWIKEYNKENDYIFDLVLDSSDANLTTELLDALYEIVFSILGSLMENEVIIKLHWYDRVTGGIRTAEISNREKISETATLLYKSDMSCTSEEFHNAAGDVGKQGMLINSRLEWYFKGEHIFSFDIEAVEKQLIGNIFDLRR